MMSKKDEVEGKKVNNFFPCQNWKTKCFNSKGEFIHNSYKRRELGSKAMIELACGGCESCLGILLYLMSGCLSSPWCQVTLLSIVSLYLKCAPHTPTPHANIPHSDCHLISVDPCWGINCKLNPEVLSWKSWCMHFLILHFDKGLKINIHYLNPRNEL